MEKEKIKEGKKKKNEREYGRTRERN